MNYIAFFVLIALAIVCLQLNLFFPAIVFLLAAVLVLIAKIGVKASKRLNKESKKIYSSLEEEWKKVEEAKPQVPKGKLEQYTQAIAKKTAEHLSAKPEEKWSARNFVGKFSQGCKNVLKEVEDWFKK